MSRVCARSSKPTRTTRDFSTRTPASVIASRGRVVPSKRRALSVASAAVLLLAGCAGGSSHALEAAGPFPYPAGVGPAFDRVAILVTVGNRSGDDLQVNPTDFLARDAQRRVFASNPAATVADARLAGQSASLRGILPLPTITLRSNEVVTGFVVFDVPAGASLVELVWRQSDVDTVVALRPTR
jgi:hypothetical protein